MRKKVKLSLIENETSRKITFTKRKKGLMKKVNELATLCDVKACAVVYSPYNSTPEAWPSREGVAEVVSNFKECSVRERTKKMVDQEAFIRQRIAKEKEQLHKLREENRSSQIKDVMFGCLEGEMDVHHLDARDMRDLNSFVDKYLNDITQRIEILTKNGESSSSLSPSIADAASPNDFNGHIFQYKNQNQQKLVQFQYKALYDLCDHIPQKIHTFNRNMNSNQNMIFDLNQNPNVEEHEDISMDNNHQKPETACLSTITNADADVCAPNNTNKL